MTSGHERNESPLEPSKPDFSHLAPELFRYVQQQDPDALNRWLADFAQMNPERVDTEADATGVATSEDPNRDDLIELGEGSLCGPFRIERKLGRGGMGSVYLASRTDDLDLQVALKTLHAWNKKYSRIAGYGWANNIHCLVITWSISLKYWPMISVPKKHCPRLRKPSKSTRMLCLHITNTIMLQLP
ncbi:hypothetical protein SCOR_00105 [Sulfidibacter corallicola]